MRVSEAFGGKKEEGNMSGKISSVRKGKITGILLAVMLIIVCTVTAVLRLNNKEDVPTQGTVNNGSGAETEIQGSAVTPEGTAPVEDIPVDEPETTEGESIQDYYAEKFPMGDLDGNGVEDYVLIENGGFYEDMVTGRLSVFINDENVYMLDHELRLVFVNSREYLDLDGDGEKELFISYGSDVNSMPLMEWIVLKETMEGWKILEMYHENNQWTANGFPITITLAKKDFDMVIRCEGLEKEVPFDAAKHYEKMKVEEQEYGNSAFREFMSEEWHQEDKVVGGVLPWGIWNIEVGTYEGRNCLVAEHGLGGPDGKYDYYGNAYVYFDFDAEGRIRLLDLQFAAEEDLYP